MNRISSSSNTDLHGTRNAAGRHGDGPPQAAAQSSRYATRATLALAVCSAVLLPLLPRMTYMPMPRHQQVAQAAVDRVTAGGGMLWLDDDVDLPVTAE